MCKNKQYLHLTLAFVQPFQDIHGGSFSWVLNFCLVQMFCPELAIVLRLNSRNYAFSPVAVVSGWGFGSTLADADTWQTNICLSRAFTKPLQKSGSNELGFDKVTHRIGPPAQIRQQSQVFTENERERRIYSLAIWFDHGTSSGAGQNTSVHPKHGRCSKDAAMKITHPIRSAPRGRSGDHRALLMSSTEEHCRACLERITLATGSTR